MYEFEKEGIAKLSAKLGEIDARARRENRTLCAREAGLYAEMEKEIDHLRKSLPANSPLTLQVDGPLGGFAHTGDTGAIVATTAATPARGKDFRSMFGVTAQERGGFKNFNEYLEVLSSQRFDGRLLEVRAAMGESVPSGGGFLVPEEFASTLLDASLEAEIVRPRATVWPMKSDVLKVPGWDSATHSSTLFGGLTGTWIAELGAATEVFAKVRQIQLTAKKLACYTAASNELVQDGIDFDRQVQQALVKTLGWYLDYSFLQGTGAGQPLGVLNDPALVQVSKEAGQKAATVVFENITKMYARLAPQCMGTAVWIASQTAVPQLLTMSLAVGTGGSMIQPAVLQQGGKFSLLGKEVLFTEKLPALGTLGDLLLVDLSQYAIGMRRELTLDKSIHAGWSTDQSSYRAIVRADGMGSWNSAITPRAGDSLSWCVALASRT